MPTKVKKSNNKVGAAGRKTAYRVAFIGAAATLSAALLAVFIPMLIGGGQQSDTGTFAVLSISFDQKSGEEVVTVTGIARNIPPGATLYAMAKPGNISVKAHQNTQASGQAPVHALAPPKARSWFVGGPAGIGSDGHWSVNIVIIPPIAGKLTVVPVEIGSCNNCAAAPPSEVRQYLGMYGPDDADAVGTGYVAQPR